MIESGPQPARRRMAALAGGREAGRNVIRIGDGHIDSLMARVAIERRARKPPADVTIRANHPGVRAGEREPRQAVVERGRGPRRGGMADFARRRKARRLVIRVRRVVILGDMAGHATCAQPHERVVDVAARTGHGDVRAGERESRFRVIEPRAKPLRRRVAERAIRREACGDVVRVGGLLESGQVAGGTSHRRACEPPTDVATRTGHVDVRSREREPGKGIVVKLRAQPTGRCMTGLAGGWEACGDVVGVSGLLESGQVAGGAVHRHACEPPADVATRTGHADVCSRKRKSGQRVVVKLRA